MRGSETNLKRSRSSAVIARRLGISSLLSAFRRREVYTQKRRPRRPWVCPTVGRRPRGSVARRDREEGGRELRARGRERGLLAGAAPGPAMPPRHPEVEFLRFLRSLLESNAIGAADRLELGGLGFLPALPGQLPEVEGAVKHDVAKALPRGDAQSFL